MKIAERSLRLLSAHWVLIERSLSVLWEIASLSDHWAIVLDQVKTLQRPWQPWRSLRDHWDIWAITGCSLKDHWEIWPFFSITQRSLSDHHPCVRGCKNLHVRVNLLQPQWARWWCSRNKQPLVVGQAWAASVSSLHHGSHWCVIIYYGDPSIY